MDNTRFYKIVIAILVLINIGTLTFFWLARPDHSANMVQKESMEPLVRGLELSPTQKKYFKSSRDAHLTQLYLLRMEDRSLHERFFDALFLPIPDTVTAKRLADSLVMIRKKMELLTFTHFQQLQKVLGPKQKSKFRKIFRGAVEQAMPPPPPPPLPPPPPPPAKGEHKVITQ